MTADNLFAQQLANRRRSRLLVAGFVAFFAWIGFGGDLAWYLFTREAPPGAYQHTIPFIGLAAMAAAAVLARISWTTGARRVLWAAGAWELIDAATPDQRRLINTVEEMSIAAGLPKPRVWLVPDPDPNAFATGLDQGDAHIAVTEGLLEALTRDELQGVVAHELAHIRNLDVRLMTLMAAMVGGIALVADGLGRFLHVGGRLMGGRGGRGGGGGSKRGNPLAVVVLVVWILSVLVAPFVSRLLALAVSRKREYLADATGAQLSRNPAALASALEKLDAATAATQSITRGAAHLCIVDPGEGRLAAHEGLLGIFASHPPIRHRIVRLNGMAFKQAKEDRLVEATDPGTS